jgi:hypothetical protein
MKKKLHLTHNSSCFPKTTTIGGFVVLSVLIVTLAAIYVYTSFTNQKDELLRLQDTFPVLERYKVQAFYDRDGCKRILYARGRFSNHKTPDCDWFSPKGLPFDKQAEDDFEIVAHVLTSSGVSLGWVKATFDVSGILRRAEFDRLPRWGLTRYVYALNPYDLRSEVPNALTYRQIADNWYLMEEH